LHASTDAHSLSPPADLDEVGVMTIIFQFIHKSS
jgi:hypothetical protein